MNKFIGWLFLFGWVMGEIFRLPGGVPVTVLDAAVGGAIISELAKICLFAVTPRITQGKPTLPTSSGSGWPRAAASSLRKFADFANRQKVGLYIIIIIASSWILGLRLFSWKQSIQGGLYLLRFLGYLWVIANAGQLLAPVKKFIIPAFWIFVILAWVQYLLLPDTRFLLRYGWDEHYYRMIGTVLDPNYLGIMLGIIGIYLIYKYTNRQIDKWQKILLVLSFGGLAVTYSRASWVAMLVVGCWLLVVGRGFRKRLGGLGILGILGVVGLIGIWWAAPKPGGEGVNLFRTNSIEQRIESWKEGINVWREHPWFGVGFNNYKISKYPNRQIDKRQTFHSENAPSSSWILLLATTGVVGIGWLVAIGSLAGWKVVAVPQSGILLRKTASSHRKFANFANYLNIKSSGVRNINRLWVGILVMVGIHAIFNNTMFYPPVLGLLALIKAASEE